jgi:cytochrome P450
MSDRDIVDNLLTFVIAGQETTALALTWTFYLLSLHPEIEERVVQEIEAVTEGGSLREEHVEALSYTRQVVTRIVSHPRRSRLGTAMPICPLGQARGSASG